MHRLVAALVAVAVWSATFAPVCAAVSPSDSSPIYTLECALDAAGATSPALAAAAAGLQATDAARVVAGLRPNPQLQVEVENIVGTGQFGGAQSAETTTGLAVPIELGGKRAARVALADRRSLKAELESAIAVAALRERVTLAYVTAVAAERRRDLAQELLDNADEGLRAASARVSAGGASPLEAQRAEVQRAKARVSVERVTREAAVALQAFARLTGEAPSTSLDHNWFEQVSPSELGALPAAADTLDMALTQADVGTAEALVRLAHTQRVPDLTLSAGARRLSASDDTAAVVGISIPLPLFNNGRAAETQAEALRAQLDAQRQMTLLDAEQAIASVQADLANAAASARAAAGPVLSAAREAARIARIGYVQGKFGQLDLLEAERTLNDSQVALVDALVAFHGAEARLTRLTSLPPAQATP